MRTAFIEEVTKLASKDKNVWLLTGDLGFSVFDDFQKKFPGQYLNVGVAEQNLIGVSAGLAMSGKKVFAYSISTFMTMRPFEQIRNNLCYQNLPVCLVGGGSTFSYSTFGCTHFPLEDVGLMRILPNMAVTVPGDSREVSALVRAAYGRSSPTYIRIAKKGEPIVHLSDKKIIFGKAVQLTAGDTVAILVCGRQLPNTIAAAQMLQKEGIKCRVLSFHTIKPLDKKTIIKAAIETKGLVTVEEHFINGGLWTAVAETLVGENLRASLVGVGINGKFPKGSGSQEYFLDKYGLTSSGIANAVRKVLRISK